MRVCVWKWIPLTRGRVWLGPRLRGDDGEDGDVGAVLRDEGRDGR